MTATTFAQAGYRRESQAVQTPRNTECDAFSRVTAQLHAASGGKGGMAAMARAIHDNRRLWYVLAADVADKANRLSADLRARIMYLAEFTDTYSSQVLSAGASAQPLIEINTAIIRGLRQQRGLNS